MSTELEWVERVGDSVVWRDGNDIPELISEMDLRRCASLISWLVGKAREIEREFCAQLYLPELEPFLPESDPRFLNQQDCLDTWDRVEGQAPAVWGEIRSHPVYLERAEHPVTWLWSTPLMSALGARRFRLQRAEKMASTC